MFADLLLPSDADLRLEKLDIEDHMITIAVTASQMKAGDSLMIVGFYGTLTGTAVPVPSPYSAAGRRRHCIYPA